MIGLGFSKNGSSFSKNGSGSGLSENNSGFFEGTASLEELKPFWKFFDKTAPSVFVEWMQEGECPYCPCFNLVLHFIYIFVIYYIFYKYQAILNL